MFPTQGLKSLVSQSTLSRSFQKTPTCLPSHRFSYPLSYCSSSQIWLGPRFIQTTNDEAAQQCSATCHLSKLSYRQHPRFCYSDHFQTEAQSGLAHAADAKSACPSAHELRLTRAATSCIARSGLIPAVPHPYKDAHGYRVPLSEQEAELDRRFTVVIEDQHSDSEQESESKRIMEAWLTRNREAQIASPAPAADEDVGKVCELKEQLGEDVTVGQSTSPSRATFVKAHSPAACGRVCVVQDRQC
ncbi:hypothetical protein A0H81_10568 [Grifola frondosa]|uniref:Uncharacterized protein n=1 Tax=Grifola frondosa TaxID=5627 RepID=A0A1C7LYL7_GRIFR|nr:hypothetical protein A0H81_10568 [Grifola frondosa]